MLFLIYPVNVLNSDLWLSKLGQSPYWKQVANINVIIYGGASETITISGLYNSPTVTTNSSGSVSYSLIKGTYTFTGGVSGQSFTRSVSSSTTDVYAMPEGALYWYGNECAWITGGWELYTYPTMDNGGYYGTPSGQKNTNSLHQNITNYCASAYITKNKIDSQQYTKAKVAGTLNVTNKAGEYFINLVNSKGTNGGDVSTHKVNVQLYCYHGDGINTYDINASLDISNFNNYVDIMLCSLWKSASYADTYALWLE